MSIEHVLPLEIRDGLTAGLSNPDVQISKFVTGPRTARGFADHSLDTFRGQLVEQRISQNALVDYRAMLRHVGVARDRFWILMPFEDTHLDLYCDAPGGASTVGYILPLIDRSSLDGVFAGGVFQDGGYNIRENSNIVESDDNANAVLTVGDVTNEGTNTTVTRSLAAAVHGRTCFKVAVSVAGTDKGLKIPYTDMGIDASRKYRWRASVLGTGTFEIHIQYYNGATPGTTLTSGGYTGSSSSWVHMEVDGTSPASHDGADFIVRRSTSSDETFFVGALGCHPGQIDKFFLPSESPPVIEFSSAPGENLRVTARGVGQKLVPVALDRPAATWRFFDVGNAAPQQFAATEVVEV